MNGDAGEADEKAHESSDNEAEEQRMISLQERRRKYYEERKKKMGRKKQPASISDILNAEQDKPIEHETRFLNVKVHTKIAQNSYAAKTDSNEEKVYLVGELEIADYLTFSELAPKAMVLFNEQLKDKGHDIELLSENSKGCAFRFAKKNGEPDSNFPSFDGAQKVSDCGVTNVCLIIPVESINYPQANPSNNASTVAATDHTSSEIVQKAPKEPMQKKKTGNLKKGNHNVERLEQTSSS